METYPEDFNFVESAKIADQILESNTNVSEGRQYIYKRYHAYLKNGFDYFIINLEKYQPVVRSLLVEELVKKFPFILYCSKIATNSVRIYDWEKDNYSILPFLDDESGKKVTLNLSDEINAYKQSHNLRSTNAFSPDGYYSLKIFHFGENQSFDHDISRYHRYSTSDRFVIGLTNRFIYDMLKSNPAKIIDNYTYCLTLVKN